MRNSKQLGRMVDLLTVVARRGLDIIESILAGTEPSGLSLAKLVKEFPLLWTGQRKKFGFPLPGQAIC